MSRRASAMPDISATTAAAEAQAASPMRSNTPQSDLGPVATGIISETAAAMVDSATTTAVATSEQRVRQRLAPENKPTPSLVKESTGASSSLSPALGLSTEHRASSTKLSDRRHSGEEKGLRVEEKVVLEPTKSTPSTFLQQSVETSPLPPTAVADNLTSATRENWGEGEPVVAPDAIGHSSGEAKTSDETPKVKEEKDGEGIEGITRGWNEAINGKEEKQAHTHDEEKADDSRIDEGDTKGAGEYEQLESPEHGGGRMVHSSAPKDGTAVWVSGRREGAAVQVVERLRPSYRLVISVTVAISNLLSTERKNGHDHNSGNNKICPPRVSQTLDGTNIMVSPSDENGGNESTVAVSLSLGKPEIKEALERCKDWVRSPVFTSDNGGIMSLPPSSVTANGEDATNQTPASVAGSGSGAAAEAADANLRRWITTGRAPRRAHLVQWLLQRLELVKGASAEDNRVAETEDEAQGRLRDAERRAGWSLVISNGDVNGKKLRRGVVDNGSGNVEAEDRKDGASKQVAMSSDDGGVGGRDGPGRQKPGGHPEAVGEDEEDPLPSHRKTSGAAIVNAVAAPRFAPQQHPVATEEGEQQRWQWWDNENPWSRGSRSSATTPRASTDGKPPASAPPQSPPTYRETVPPPPYREATGDLSPSKKSRSPTRKSASKSREQQESHRSPPSIDAADTSGLSLRAGSVALRDGASVSTSSGEDTSRGPPPSYRSVSLFSLSARGAEDEREKKPPVRGLPPPSYGRFYEPRAATEWWGRDDGRQIYNQSESSEQERERRRRRRDVVSDGGGGNAGRRDEQHLTFRDRTAERPGTNDGMEELRHGGRPGGWQRRRDVEGRRTSTAVGGSRRNATTTRAKDRHQDSSGLPLTGTESWDDDRWRLTRYLQSCKKELTEAEERRRRAEVAANAAERSAWKTAAGNPNGGDDDASKRAWAREATQRVLDLMLVTERVRQEEQKRRVAAARANNQVARCKQPFRERRGRSQKGPVIGPSVPPVDYSTVPSRNTQRTEATGLDKFYWDEHGRRYARRSGDRSVDVDVGYDGDGGDGGDDRDEPMGEVGVALEAVREVAMACLEEGTDFAQPFRDMDADGDGRLTLAELGAALKRVGARLSLSQVAALFRYFDEGLGLDTVGRGDFLWEFVNTRRLLKQWRKAGDGSGGDRARTAPFRDRAKMALSYRGGSDGTALSRDDVLRALEQLGIDVYGWQADALLDRFTLETANDSEQVDWRALVSFLQAAENEDDGNKSKNAQTAMAPGRREMPYTTTRPRRGVKPSDRFPRQRQRQDQRQAQQQRQKQHWATSGGPHRAGGGLFEGGGGTPATWRSRPTRPIVTTPTTPMKPAPTKPNFSSTGASASSSPDYEHWASSVPDSIGGRRNRNAVGGADKESRKTGMSQGGGEDYWGGWTRGGSTTEAQRRRDGGRFSIATPAEASRVLDGLLEDQRELEAFLQAEFAKRENGGDAGQAQLRAGVGFDRQQEV